MHEIGETVGFLQLALIILLVINVVLVTKLLTNHNQSHINSLAERVKKVVDMLTEAIKAKE